MPYNRIPLLGKRHKLEIEKSNAVPVELLEKHISRYDESGLARLLLEISLLESAYRSGGNADSDVLLTTARRYRIDSRKGEERRRKGDRRQTKKEAEENPRPTKARPELPDCLIFGGKQMLSAFFLTRTRTSGVLRSELIAFYLNRTNLVRA